MASFLLDENVPHSLVDALKTAGHDVRTAQDVGLESAPDERVFEHAQGIGAAIISQDLDFSDLRLYSPVDHHGIVLLRLSRLTPAAMALRTVQALTNEAPADLRGRLFVIAPGRSR